LFSKAQSYAKEIGIQELKAKQYANLLKQLTQKAQNNSYTEEFSHSFFLITLFQK